MPEWCIRSDVAFRFYWRIRRISLITGWFYHHP